MLALGLVLNTVGIAFSCWLIFALAVYAFPFFVGVGVGLAALHSGAGVMVALLVGIGSAALTLVVGQVGFAITRSGILRAVVAAAFVVPAGIAGYHLVLGISQIGVPSLVWREVFAWLGAVLIGMTAWARISAFTEPRPVERGRAFGNKPQSVLAGAPREV
jgi:hypothetical protein